MSKPRRTESGVTYCIVPRELEGELPVQLLNHWLGEPTVRVVVERREAERRQRVRRSGGEARAPSAGERRKLRSEDGRRLADRRAVTVAAVNPPSLPDEAAALSDRLVFVQRLAPSENQLEDTESLRLVLRVQAGDESAFAELYLGHFDNVCSYLRTALRDFHEAEDVTQRVFLRVLRALPRYEVRRGTPFRAWLFRIARNEALRHLRKQGIVEVEDPTTVERRRELDAVEDEPGSWDWLSDAELSSHMDQLPLAQRQALTLRHLVGLNVHEIAVALERTPEAVRMLEHRGMRVLRQRLTEGGYGHGRIVNPRTPMLVRVRRAPVLRGRRFALEASRTVPALSLGRAAWRPR